MATVDDNGHLAANGGRRTRLLYLIQQICWKILMKLPKLKLRPGGLMRRGASAPTRLHGATELAWRLGARFRAHQPNGKIRAGRASLKGAIGTG